MSERRDWRPQLALARLEARRTLRSQVGLFALVLIALVWAGTGTQVGLEDSAAHLRGLLRQRVGTGVLLVLAPLALWRAAGLPARWRAGEADWLAPRRTGRLAVAGWSTLGTLTATLALVALAGACVELRLGEATSSAQRLAGQHDLDRTRAIEPGQAAELALTAPALGTDASLRLRVTVIAGRAPTSQAYLTVRSASSDAFHARRVTVTGRTWVECPLPGDGRELVVRLDNEGEGLLAVLDDGALQWWEAGGSERSAALHVVLHSALALVTALPLAAGLGAWISPTSSVMLVLLTWLVAAASRARPYIGGTDLGAALAIIGEGRLPGGPSALAFCGLAVTLALGAALLVTGTRSWRHAP